MARLDAVMVQQGMVPSRQRAKTLIQNGQISVNGKVCTKPAFAVSETDRIAMEGSDIPFVGRGGLKLEHAVQQMQLSLEGMVCLDIGASTGGFTDCMLQHGAAKVYAIDVGHGQLVQSLREDPRVVNWEGTDVRSIAPGQLKQPADFFSADVSFISLHHVLPYVLPLLRTGAQGVVLIKPQFEAGRENIGKNGLVQSSRVHMQVLNNILQLFSAQGLTVQLLCPSPIQGGSGNIEYLAVVQKGGEAAYLPEIAAVVQQAFAQAKKEKTKRQRTGSCPKGLSGTAPERHGSLGRSPLSGTAGGYVLYLLRSVSGSSAGRRRGSGDRRGRHHSALCPPRGGHKGKAAGHQHRTAGLSGIYGAGSDR